MPFEPGARLGRIRIDALLGVGGMGAVYRGFDEKLERPVAVKEIHSDKRTAAVRTRFLREARALSQLDHPNICRIYDVLERVEGDYLILEYIDGETLRERAARGLGSDEALRIALKVARVLELAHARGIVHRDLKPDNVMLTRSGEVKVLDFGLARFAGETHLALDEEAFASDDIEKTAVLGRPQSTTAPDATHTFAGSLVGTITYMSPEQARGLPVDSASDIYSLGVLLFEVLTGHRAYGEPEGMNELLRKVRSADIAWRDLGSRELNALVHRLTRLHPGERPSAAETVAAIENVLAKPARIRKRWLVAGFAAALLTFGASAFLVASYIDEARAILSSERRGRIALLPFRNETGDRSLQWVEVGLQQLVAGSLASMRDVKIVPPEETLRAMRSAGVARAKVPTEEQRKRVLQILGAEALIEAAVIADEEPGRYTIRFAAASRERIESPREVTSSILTEAANQMVRDIALRLDPHAPAADLRTRYSADAFANTAFAIGEQERLVRGPKVAARYYAVAIDRDPELAAAKLRLSKAHADMGNYAEAVRLATEVIAQARRRGDARMHASALDRLAHAHVDFGKYEEGERAATAALQLATRSGDDQAAMNAHNTLGYAAWRTNRLDRADAMFRAAYALAVRLGDVPAQSRWLNNLGLIAEDRNRYDEANRLYAQALKLADRANDRDAMATLIGNLANVKSSTGNPREAEALMRRQLALARELGDLQTELIALVNLAIATYSRGDEEEAIRLTAQAADVAAKTQNVRIEAIARSNLATARTKRGELEQAGRDAQEALALLPRLAGDVETAGDVRLAYAYWLIRMGRVAEAETLIAKVEREWKVGARSLQMRGRAAWERGDRAAAARYARQAKAAGESLLRQDEEMIAALIAGRGEFEGVRQR